MLLADTIADVRTELAAMRGPHSRIGLVPTMGALHDGHWSLIERCVRECDVAVVSIFVNPLQFAPQEDLDRYPQTLTADLSGCRQRGVALTFTPSVENMYPGRMLTRVHVDQLSDVLCGASRQGHFDGVSTVVCKLLNIVQPQVAYFGEKDYQQLVLIRRMTRELSLPVEIVGCPIVRDADGLALSSRNAYLSPADRERALVIHAALHAAVERSRGGVRDPGELVAGVSRMLGERVDFLEYVSLVDAESLSPVNSLDRPTRLCVAVRIGRTRLIDNVAVDGRADRH